MFPASVVEPDVNRIANDDTQRDPWNRDRYNIEHASDQIGTCEDGLMGTDFNMMNTVGQTWLWDNVSW